MQRLRRILAGTTVALALVGGLSGCSGTPKSTGATISQPAGPACPTPVQPVADPRPLAIVAAQRRNSPTVTSLPKQVCTAIANAVAGSAPISLVRLDGRPTKVGPTVVYTPTARNDEARKSDFESFVAGVGRAVLSVRAEVAHVDVRQAISVAADALHDGSDSTAGQIFVVGSALQETGTPNFSTRGMLYANPSELATYLDSRHLTPDLKHITLTFIGAGTTATPQAELDTADSQQLESVWHAIGVHGKAAAVSFLPPAATGGAMRTGTGAVLPAVATVTLPQVPPWNPHQVFLDSGPLHFKPDQAVLLDPAAARIALQPVPGWLALHPSCSLVDSGTTARVGDRAGQIALGKARAAMIRYIIIQLGADPHRIRAVGLGSYFVGYAPDHDPQTGLLWPDKAALNRTVRFTPVCPPGMPS